VDRLQTLEKFMQQVNKGLDVFVDEDADGKVGLMRVMEDIRDVKKAMDITQEMFQPLQNILNALKAHGMDMTTLPKVQDKVLQDYLDEAPMAWDAVIKKTFKKKEEVNFFSPVSFVFFLASLLDAIFFEFFLDFLIQLFLRFPIFLKPVILKFLFQEFFEFLYQIFLKTNHLAN
jgi:hypothetical protein